MGNGRGEKGCSCVVWGCGGMGEWERMGVWRHGGVWGMREGWGMGVWGKWGEMGGRGGGYIGLIPRPVKQRVEHVDGRAGLDGHAGTHAGGVDLGNQLGRGRVRRSAGQGRLVVETVQVAAGPTEIFSPLLRLFVFPFCQPLPACRPRGKGAGGAQPQKPSGGSQTRP